MIIRIEPESDIPIYVQITNQIIDGIARGVIESGSSLPSVRALASDLGVNMHTVNKSYHELEKKGIIRIVPKSGAVISAPREIPQSSIDRLKNEFKLIIAESLVAGMSEDQIETLVSAIIEDYSNHQKGGI